MFRFHWTVAKILICNSRIFAHFNQILDTVANGATHKCILNVIEPQSYYTRQQFLYCTKKRKISNIVQ